MLGMNFYRLFLIGSVLVSPIAFAQSVEYSYLDGYVTRAASPADFDVNGILIVCHGKGKPHTEEPVNCLDRTPYIGMPLRISGDGYEGNRTFQSDRIRVASMNHGEISGSAVIDVAPARNAANAPSPGLAIHADGYTIMTADKTQKSFVPPLNALSDAAAGDWIEYKGKLDPSGVLLASSVTLAHNTIGSKEEELHVKEEFDPSPVPPGAKEAVSRKMAAWFDPKKFPPFNNPAMQARLDEIGNKLIPSYQRQLPDSDPAKIHFRFRLIDTKLFRGALTLSSGIILVPHQVVERLQNDSQLAAVLADSIACAIERQEYRLRPEKRVAEAVVIAGIFPGGGLAGDLVRGSMITGGEAGYSKIQSEWEGQSGRVSLELLHDAGYDIDQAPIAWWLLSSWDQEPISQIDLPDRAKYLYLVLGEIWHNPNVAANSSAKP